MTNGLKLRSRASLCESSGNHREFFSEPRSRKSFQNDYLKRRSLEMMDLEPMTHGPTDPHRKAEVMEGLFRAHGAELERRIAKIVGSRETARDIVQDTFLKIHQSWPAEVRSPIALLYSVAHARAVDLVRRQATAAAHQTHVDPPQSIPSPELRLLRDDATRYFRDTIAGLKDTERKILRLRSDGFTFAQIAERLGKTSDAVAKTVFRALKRCRKRLRDLEIDADDIGSSGFE